MTSDVIAEADAVLRAAATLYKRDAPALAVIAQLQTRLQEPLRLAIAGMVKAGKSTLLNAALGEQIAPTDTGECTRVVTWYRYSSTPTVTMHPRKGAPRRMPIRRERGRLVLSLDELTAEEVEWIDVGWPLEGLKSVILIDTPGIGSLSEHTSARTKRFLTPDASPSAADAVIYLMRHLHGADVRFLEAFRDTAAGAAQTVCAVGVLSRSDEIGSGRIDSLLSAGKVAQRYERDGDLASLVLRVIPVAGLLAEGARTLRESEYIAFRELAGLERADRERLIVSADRFTRPSTATTLSTTVRQDLLARFGLFGVRLATALIRGGVRSSSELSEQMVQQSGLIELQDFVRAQFQTRAATLKTRGVLLQLQQLLREHPRDDLDEIHAGIERVTADAHTLRELALLATARSSGLPLADTDAADAQRIAGAEGTAAHLRLGMSGTSEPDALRAQVAAKIDHWHRVSQAPTAERSTVSVCRVVLRSLDEIASEVGAGRGLGASSDVMLAGGPGDGLGHHAGEQGEKHEPRLGGKKRWQRFTALAQRHPFR
ncbi:GTP-binding protein [Microbacterium sp. CH12i]|uniref:dynamin family protein n=1 Tax=Microbacterium sp. CH12i TaxID=1479651 RepID=UPI0004611BE7|nr:dynamin family protein [Microbacterium sp. CH12i]KDA06405.1 GTP-binding protein [Microbacterium sp. CH12i]